MDQDKVILATLQMYLQASPASIGKINFNDEATKMIWLGKLRDIPLNRLRDALDKISGDLYFPSPNAIRKEALGDEALTSDEAFEKVWTALGQSEPHRYSLPALIQSTMAKIGGWRIASDWKDSTRSQHKKTFKAAFDDVSTSHLTGAPLLDAAKKAENSMAHSNRSMGAAYEQKPKKQLQIPSDLPPIFGRIGVRKPKKDNPNAQNPILRKAKQELGKWAAPKVRSTAFKQRIKDYAQDATVDQMVAALWYAKEYETFPSTFELVRAYENNAAVQELKTQLSRSALRIVEDNND